MKLPWSKPDVKRGLCPGGGDGLQAHLPFRKRRSHMAHSPVNEGDWKVCALVSK